MSQLRIISREIQSGRVFLHSAEVVKDAEGRRQFLAYARTAHATATQVLRRTDMEPDQRLEFQRQLDALDATLSELLTPSD